MKYKKVFTQSFKKKMEIGAALLADYYTLSLYFKMPCGIVERVDLTPGNLDQVLPLLQSTNFV